MCTDYTNLNKACPKDLYPLPSIDCLVDEAFRFLNLPFLDAYFEYNQILMFKQDEEKTTFIIDMTIYFYSDMPFSLKNVGATYQRLIDMIFVNQLKKNLKVYVDDMEVKSTSTTFHV